MFLHADSEDSDQTGRMHRLMCLRWAQLPFCWFCHAAAHVYIAASQASRVSLTADPGVAGSATYRLLKLIMRVFSLIEKGSCQMFNLYA